VKDEPVILVPMVCTESNGGEYEDASFSAGMAFAETNLMLRSHKPGGYRCLAPRPLLRQLDLLAMELGYLMEARPCPMDEEEWAVVTFRRRPDPPSLTG
jgi:hypothetical protein